MRRLIALLMLVLLFLQAPALQAATACCDDCPEAALCASAGHCQSCVNAALPSSISALPVSARAPQTEGSAWSPRVIERFPIWRPPWRNSPSTLFDSNPPRSYP